jgi:hypothetical protein
MDTKKIFDIIKILDKYPLEIVFVKHLMLNGIDSEEKLIELLKTDNTLSQVWKVKLHNAFRDLLPNRGMYDFKKIPILFK